MKEITYEDVELIEEYLELTPEQKKAITNLKKAFTRCRKLGLEFWDNYGSFTVYDGKKMSKPVPDDADDFNYEQGDNCIRCAKSIREAGDTCGNADDTCQFNLIGVTLEELRRKKEDEEDE